MSNFTKICQQSFFAILRTNQKKTCTFNYTNYTVTRLTDPTNLSDRGICPNLLPVNKIFHLQGQSNQYLKKCAKKQTPCCMQLQAQEVISMNQKHVLCSTFVSMFKDVTVLLNLSVLSQIDKKKLMCHSTHVPSFNSRHLQVRWEFPAQRWASLCQVL